MAAFTPYDPTAPKPPATVPFATYDPSAPKEPAVVPFTEIPPDTPPQNEGAVRFSDPEDKTAVRIGRAMSALQLDTDPTGEMTVEWGRMNNCGYDYQYVKSANVFGRIMSREQLEETENGRELIRTMEANRRGEQRGFWDALKPSAWSKNDLPFFGTVASLMGSVQEARSISDTFGKIVKGEAVTNDEAIAARLYMAKSEQEANATWGAHVGDIVRTTPGFMVEFGVSGKLFGAARGLLNKAIVGTAKKSSSAVAHLGVDYATKQVGKMAAREAVTALAEKTGAETVAAGVRSLAEMPGAQAAAKKAIAGRILGMMETSPATKGWSAATKELVAASRAELEYARAVSVMSSNSAVVRGIKSTWQAAKGSAFHALMDFGPWQSAQAAVAYTRNSTAGQALGRALSTLCIEAPLRGAMMTLPNRYIARPLISAAYGGTVDSGALGIQSSAATMAISGSAADREFAKRLYDESEGRAYGAMVMQYAAADAGRAMEHIFGAIGLGLGFMKPAQKVIGTAGAALGKPVASVKMENGKIVDALFDGLLGGPEVDRGGLLRKLVQKAYANNTVENRLKATTEALTRATGTAVDEQAVAKALAAKRVDLLPRAAQSVVGNDLEKYASNAFKDYLRTQENKGAIRTFMTFTVADYMARHGVGPDAVLNAFDRMGYHGILGTVFGMRYGGFMTGFFGFNDHNPDSWTKRLDDAFHGAWPGWSQLTAEAVGFMFPMIVRSGTLRAQRAIGGGNRLTKLQELWKPYQDLTRTPFAMDWKLGDFKESTDAALRAMDAEITTAESTPGREQDVASLKQRRKSFSDLYEAFKSRLTPEQQADPNTPVAVEMVSQGLSDFALKMKPSTDSTTVHAAIGAHDAIVENAGLMAQMAVQLETPLPSEKMSWWRRQAHRLVGVAGAIATADLELAKGDPLMWRMVDYGAPADILTPLKNGYKKVLSEALREVRESNTKFAEELADRRRDLASQVSSHRITQEEMDAQLAEFVGSRGDVKAYEADMAAAHDIALRRFTPLAQDIMRAQLAAHQVRMFSSRELLDIATLRHAESAGYVSSTEDPRTFIRLARRADGSDVKYERTTSEHAEKVTYQEYYDLHAEEINELRDSAAKDVFQILTAGSASPGAISMSRIVGNESNPVVPLIKIPQGLPTARRAMLAMVLKSMGLRDLVRVQEVRDDLPSRDFLSSYDVPREWVDRIIESVLPTTSGKNGGWVPGDIDVGTADPNVLEAIAHRLNFTHDGTAADLARRNREIVQLCMLADIGRDPNVVRVSRELAVEDDRLQNSAYETLKVRRGSDGMFTFRQGGGDPIKAATADELLQKVSADGWRKADPHIIFTDAQTLQSGNYLTMIRFLNEQRRYVERTAHAEGTEAANRVDPLYRKKSDGSWLYTEEQANGKRADEMAKADKFRRLGGEGVARVDDFLTDAERALPEGADRDRALDRATREYNECRADWYRCYDEKTGYVTVAEGILRERGVDFMFLLDSVSGRTGHTQYTLSMDVFREVAPDGNIYVPVDHERAQDYKGAVLNAQLVHEYFANRQFIQSQSWRETPTGRTPGNFTDFQVRLGKITDHALDRARRDGNEKLVKNLEDFRAAIATGAEQGVRRAMSPQMFALLASQLGMFQLERGIAENREMTVFDAALREIAPTVRMDPTFWGFVGDLDRILGGDGFDVEALLARSPDAQPDASKGIRRYLAVLGGTDGAFRKAYEEATPGGMTYEEFVEAANRQNAASGRPRFRPEQRSPERSSNPVMDMYDAMQRLATESARERGHEIQDMPAYLLALVRNQLAAGRPVDERFNQSLNDPPRPEPRAPDAVERERTLTQAQVELAGLEAELEHYRGMVAEGTASQDELQAAELCIPELERLVNEKRTEVDTLRAEMNGVEPPRTEPPPETPRTPEPETPPETPRTPEPEASRTPEPEPETNDDPNAPPEGWSVRDVDPVADPAARALAPDGSFTHRLEPERAEFPSMTKETAEATVPILARLTESLRPGSTLVGEAADSIVKMAQYLFRGLSDSDVMLLREAVVAKQNDALDFANKISDGWAWGRDGADEGLHQSGNEGFNDQSVAAYRDNKPLNTFLDLARIANPHTGRNFQAFVNDMRELNRTMLADVRESLKGVSDASKLSDLEKVDAARRRYQITAAEEAVGLLERILNPRADMVGKTDCERDANFRLLLDSLTDADGNVSPLVSRSIAALLTRGPNGQPVNRKGALFLAYIASLKPNVRQQMTMLLSSSAASDPLRVNETELPGGRRMLELEVREGMASQMSEATVASAFYPLVGMDAGRLTKLADTLEASVKGKLTATGDPLARLEANGKAVAYALRNAGIIDSDSPVFSALTSKTLVRDLRGKYANGRSVSEVDELVQALGADKAGKSTMVSGIADELRGLARDIGKGRVDRDTLAKAMTRLFTTGQRGTSSLLYARFSSRTSGQWNTLMSLFEASMPRTIMTAELDPRRTNQAASSVAIASRGVVPIVQRFLDGGFAALQKKRFGATDADIAQCRQDMTWADPARTRIIGKSISKSYSQSEVLDACRMAYALEIAKSSGKGSLEHQAGVLMVAKLLGDTSTAGLIEAANRIADHRSTGKLFVPVYAGDHASSVILQMPLTMSTRKALTKAGADALKLEFDKRAGAVSRMFGLDLLGSDTKRSAISSAEAPSVGLIGVRVRRDADGKETREYGHARIIVGWNWKSEKNEDYIGTTLGFGYGFEQMRRCARDSKSYLEKIHVMGSAGKYLSLFKSLNVSIPADAKFGNFLEGDSKRTVMDFLRNYAGADADINSYLYTDFDSNKVSATNSKSLGVDESGDLTPLMKYVFGKVRERAVIEGGEMRGVRGADGKLIEGDLDAAALDELVGKFQWSDEANGDSGERSVSDILGKDVELKAIDGLNGKSYGLSYVDDGLKAYQVANVSHVSRATTGRAPRNYLVDSTTMEVAQERGAADGTFIHGYAGPDGKTVKFASRETRAGVQNLVADWGLFAATVCTDPRTVEALLAESSQGQALREAGEAEGGQNLRSVAARECFAHLRDNLSIPVRGVDAPLVSSGASVRKDGTVFMHTTSRMHQAMMQGRKVIPLDQQAFYKATSQFALANVNYSDITFRHAWFLDEKAALGNEKYKAAYKASNEKGDRKHLEAIESLFTQLHDAKTAEEASELREAIASSFVDHHGMSIAKKMTGNGKGRVADYFGIEDLFTGINGKIEFDRTAVQIENRRVWLDADDGKPGANQSGRILLGGTLFGLPRTPSYNGSMWMQAVRAGLPVTEIERTMRGKDGKQVGTGDFSPGRDAMVSPDPFTNKILGCDHDGDKSKLYLFWYGRDGKAERMDPKALDFGQMGTGRDAFINDTEGRRAHIERLAKMGLVDKVDAETSVGVTYNISEAAQQRASNSFVGYLFDLARMAETPEAAKSGEWRTFSGGPMSRDTKACPIDPESPAWKELSREFVKSRNVFEERDAEGRVTKRYSVADPDRAALAATSAMDAADARADIVSLAKALHYAYMSGYFGEGSAEQNLLGKVKAKEWIDFIYHIDGYSNATFDDIKEQICSKLGWTHGMMDTLIVDMLVSGERPPTTDAEFAKLVRKYAADAQLGGGGSRSYMRMAVDVTDAENFQPQLRRLFAGRPDGWIKKGGKDSPGVYTFFGIEEKSNGDIVSVRPDPEKMSVGEAIVHALNWAGIVSDPKASDAAVRALADAARNNGVNVNAGYAYYLVKKAAQHFKIPMKTVSDLNTIMSKQVDLPYSTELRGKRLVKVSDVRDKFAEAMKTDLREFAMWAQKRAALQAVRSFTAAVDFANVDPGNDSKAGRVDSMADWFRNFESHVPTGADKMDFSVFQRMHTATMLAYRLGNGAFRTEQARASTAAENYWKSGMQRAHQLAKLDGRLANVAAGMLAADTLKGRRLELATNAQTLPYIMAAFSTVPSLPGSKLNGALNAYDTLAKAARAVYVHRSKGKGYAPNLALELRKGVEDAFDLMYKLISTSTSHAQNGFVSYFSERADTSYGRDFGESGHDLYSIMPQFRGMDGMMVKHVQDLVADVVDGAFDPGGKLGKRVLAFTGKPGQATDFTLSVKNLEAMRAEARAEAGAKEEAKAKAAKKAGRSAAASDGLDNKDLVKLEAQIDLVEAMIKETGDITPSMMMGQLIPLYSSFTSRTTGPAEAGGSALVSLIPNMYRRWSAAEAFYNTPGSDTRDVMDGLLPVNFFPRNVRRELKNARRNLPEAVNGKQTPEAEKMIRRATMGRTYTSGNDIEMAGKTVVKANELTDSYEESALAGTVRGQMRAGTDYIQENPRNRATIDIFSNGQMLRHALDYLVSRAPDRIVSPRFESAAEAASDAVRNGLVGKDGVPAAASDASAMDAALKEGRNPALAVTGKKRVLPQDIADAKVNKPASTAAKKPEMQKLADAISNMTSLWNGAKVEYEGGDVITIRGRITGSAAERVDPNGSVNAVITVRRAGKTADLSPEDIGRIASSRSYAESISAVTNFGLTADRFLALPDAARAAFVRRYGIGGVASTKPTFSIDGKGIATLAGAITIADDAKSSTVYHEYFHSMIGMFREMQMFSKADVKALQKTFGKSGKGWFNEEKAAEAFRKYVKDGVLAQDSMVRYGADRTSETIFQRFLSAIKGIFNSLVHGFSYGDEAPADETLFSLVLTGHAQESREGLARWKTPEQARAAADALRVSHGIADRIAEGGFAAASGGAQRSFTEEQRQTLGKDYMNREAMASLRLARSLMTNDATQVSEALDGLYALREAGLKQLGLPSEAKAAPEPPPLPQDHLRFAQSVEASADYTHDGMMNDLAYMAGIARSMDPADRMNVPYSEFYARSQAIADVIAHGIMGDRGRDSQAYRMLKAPIRESDKVAGIGLAQAVAEAAVRDVVDTIGGHEPTTKKVADLVFENLLFLENTINQSFLKNPSYRDGRPETKYYNHAEEHRGDRSKAKDWASEFDVAGALVASFGRTPEDVTGGAIESIRKMIAGTDPSRPRYPEGSGQRQVLEHCIEQLERIHTADPTGLISDVHDTRDLFSDVYAQLSDGIVSDGRDRDGKFQDYRLGGDSNAPYRERNQAMYGNYLNREAAGPDVQEALKLSMRTALLANAMLKYHRDIGFVRGLPEDATIVDFGARNVPPPESFADTARRLGIGIEQLMSDDPLVGFYDQSAFIAKNMGPWLDSTIRKTFGHVPVEENMRANSRELLQYTPRCMNVRNVIDRLLGQNLQPGDYLDALVEKPSSWQMAQGGVVTHGEGGPTAVYFDGFNKKKTKVRVDADDIRCGDMLTKSDAARVCGQDRIVTGVNRIAVTRKSFQSREIDRAGGFHAYYSRDAIEARRRQGKNLDPLENALWRLKFGVPKEILEGPNGIYEDVVSTLEQSLKKACREMIPDDRGGTRILTDAEINHRVLSELESKGLGARYEALDSNGSRHTQSAAITIPCNRVEAWFESSPLREKLRQAGRTDDMLSFEARTEPLMKLFREASEVAKNNPWLTEGDGRFFNNFGTPLPFFRGTGVFMYAAERKARSEKRSYNSNMPEYTNTYLGMLQTIQTRKYIGEISDAQLEFLRDTYKLRERNAAELRQAIRDGKYEAGTRDAQDSGLVFSAKDSNVEMARKIYERLCELSWSESIDDRDLVARFGGEQSVADMIQAYEGQQGVDGTVAGALGLNDVQMFRLHGALPANMQLGHKVQAALDGITNAIYFRNSLMNMLMTADVDGRPTCYARPTDIAAEAGGVPDEHWAMLARWWAQSNGLRYDSRQSGIKNAQRLYNEIHGTLQVGKENVVKRVLGGRTYGELLAKDMDVVSLDGFIARNDNDEAGDPQGALANAGGGYAMAYAKHLFQSSRTLGNEATRATIHRALGWSKALSVCGSFFFPLATRWESPIGATGVLATIGSNLAPSLIRKNPKLMNGLTKFFGGGWFDKNFIGFKDIVKMLDSNDPFIAELRQWAHALGVTLSDSNVNPVEPQRSIVQSDLAKLREMVRSSYGDKAARTFNEVADFFLLRAGDKAFNYALNATKLATVAQLAMKLRHHAEKLGKAFDPIRDLRKFSNYINAEIGGLDPLRYAWAHPKMRSLMSMLMFSWEWTRGAWEAGGGEVLEDLFLGSHRTTAETRKYMIGRWARMYGAVMVGVPMMIQMASYAMARALGHKDDKDSPFTWDNESKTFLSAANITPLMRAIEEKFGDSAGWVGTGVGALTTGIHTAATLGPGALLSWRGAARVGLGAAIGSQIPRYTGNDPANQTTRNREYYIHFGKQGWEEVRWFKEPLRQFTSKLSMPLQRLTEGFLGRNLSWLDRELPFAKMGDVERWLTLTRDGAAWNLLKAFMPFSAAGFTEHGDAGFLSMVGPVQMGASETNLQDRLEERIGAFASNDREYYAWGANTRLSKKAKYRNMFIGDIIQDARKNGYSKKQIDTLISEALGRVQANLYKAFFRLIPQKPTDSYDTAAVEKVVRSLNRIQAKTDGLLSSVKKQLEKQGREWKKMSKEERRFITDFIAKARQHPFGTEDQTGVQSAGKAGDGKRLMGNFLVTDDVPDTLFGFKIVADEKDYTEEDKAFFKEHPEAGGYYDLGEDGADEPEDELPQEDQPKGNDNEDDNGAVAAGPALPSGADGDVRSLDDAASPGDSGQLAVPREEDVQDTTPQGVPDGQDDGGGAGGVGDRTVE